MHDTNPHTESWLTQVAVEGLHKRLSFQVNLQPGVNIIYGKNGLGKTTLLHVIANLSEIDLARFNYLSFQTITVRNNNGGEIRLVKDEGVVSVFVNGNRTSYLFEKSELSDAEKADFRSVIGDRATYLPAFRSVLERMRETNYAQYEDRARPEFEALRQAEWSAYKSSGIEDRETRRDPGSVESTVYKTLRCRQWFGSFVPVVRYPSITDVVSGLGEEWTAAQIAISKVEQKQFESAFVEIFSAISQEEISNEQQDQQILLDEIKELVAFDDSRVQGPTNLPAYLQLVEIAKSNYVNKRNYGNILKIYRDKLRDRKVAREVALRPLSTFQESVNLFLNEKCLRVANRPLPRLHRLRDSAVFIEPSAGATYGITALSSGERQIVTMLYSTSRSPFRAGCCLIDEPELSLHVDWQRSVLKQIETQHKGRQIIACTHSPEVGADHESRVQFFAPQSLSAPDEEVDGEEGSAL